VPARSGGESFMDFSPVKGWEFAFSRRGRSGGEQRKNGASRLSAVTLAAPNLRQPALVTPSHAVPGPARRLGARFR